MYTIKENGVVEIYSQEMITSWEYIYTNPNVLLKVDQNGIISAQNKPPQDIILFQRSKGEKTSPWLVYIKDKTNGECFSNFGFPVFSVNSSKPDTLIRFSPEKAEYHFKYRNIEITTVVGIHSKEAKVFVETTIKNISDSSLNIEIMPGLIPYINEAMLAPWDKPEWYLQTGICKKDFLGFFTLLTNSSGIKEKRRFAAFYSDIADFAEVSLERFMGAGSFHMPDSLKTNSLNIKLKDIQNEMSFEDKNTMGGYPPVYASKINADFNAGEQKTFAQVFSVLDSENFEMPDIFKDEKGLSLLNKDVREKEIESNKIFYNEFFSKCGISTGNEDFDNYINGFLPLQMYWVASLDRGWPTGMRGTRDAVNDFIGMLHYEPNEARKIIKFLASSQRSDGWFPRQISCEGKFGKHDLRNFADGGAFFLELVSEYLNRTADSSILHEKTTWLDNDLNSTILDHIKETFNFYLDKKNIGEHGLCKIWGGDWLDAIGNAGNEGRGESVTITCQIVLALKAFTDIFESLNIDDDLKNKYCIKAEIFAQNIQKAFNEGGFYSSVFNDDGKWLFSNNDPDGKSRMYGPANYFAIFSGAAKEKADSIWARLPELKTEYGYKLFENPFEKISIPKAGRIASGDMSKGLWENGSVYNHGSQGFLMRAAAYSKRADILYDALMYLLPYSQNHHPVSESLSPPYAIVNCYQSVAGFEHRGGMQFLTGTIAMAVRGIYNWMFGYSPNLKGFEIKPVITYAFCNSKVFFFHRGKKININFTEVDEVCLNGKTIKKDNGRIIIEDTMLSEFNVINFPIREACNTAS